MELQPVSLASHKACKTTGSLPGNFMVLEVLVSRFCKPGSLLLHQHKTYGPIPQQVSLQHRSQLHRFLFNNCTDAVLTESNRTLWVWF